MARAIGYLFGTVLVVVGMWGFVQNPVFGVFASNTLHSIVHLLSGAILLGVAAWRAHTAAFWLKLFGIVYALIAICGFVMGGDMLMGMIDNSVADSILHTLLAIVFLWAGFMAGDTSTDEAPLQPSL